MRGSRLCCLVLSKRKPKNAGQESYFKEFRNGSGSPKDANKRSDEWCEELKLARVYNKKWKCMEEKNICRRSFNYVFLVVD